MKNKRLKFTVTNNQVSIWPLCMLGEMLLYEIYKMGGINQEGPLIGEWKNRVNRWANDPEKWDVELARRMLSLAEKNPKVLLAKAKMIPKAAKKLLKCTEKIFVSDLKIKTDRALLKLYEDFRKEYIDSYTYFWIPNSIEGKANYFSLRMDELVRSRLKGKEDRTGEYLSILITPQKITNREKEEQGLLEIACMINKNKYLKKAFLSKDAYKIERELLKYPEIYRCLTNHEKKYAWIPFDYDGPAWGLSDFFVRVKDILSAKVNPASRIRLLKKEKHEILEKQKKIEKEIGLSNDKKICVFVELARELMYLKDFRKDTLFQAYYLVDKLIREIAQRLSLTSIQVKHILPQEMEAVLLRRKYSEKDLNERIKYSVLVYKKSNRGSPKFPIKIYTGDEAKTIIKKYVYEEKIKTDLTELKGQPAFSGAAKGRVKLIFNKDDIVKMGKGDILVSHSTNPNLLPAMKIAAAIITDTGGITCHAAIVSRELKIPCVIGTKLATKILKDGDLVEVDANQGVVRLINKK